MHEKDLYVDKPTLDEQRSRDCLIGLFSQQGWMSYSSKNNPRLPTWISRYLSLHAKIPAYIQPTEQMLFVPAMFPIDTFRIMTSNVIVDGGHFSNGGVVRMRFKSEMVKFLLVDKTVAELFKYPLQGIEINSDVIRKSL